MQQLKGLYFLLRCCKFGLTSVKGAEEEQGWIARHPVVSGFVLWKVREESKHFPSSSTSDVSVSYSFTFFFSPDGKLLT